jgi:beta-glucanase (GH16 family)
VKPNTGAQCCQVQDARGGEASISRRASLKTLAAVMLAPAIVRSSFAAAPAEADPTHGRSLVFEDHFATLDTAIWNAGRKATTFDSGFYGRSAFARIDGEEGFNPYAIVDDGAAEDGKALQISAQYIGRPMNIHGYHGNNLPEFQWVSGNIQTAKADGSILKSWRKGYFEARMACPLHPLSWSAFWLMNGRSILFPQTSVELDVVEHKGFEPDSYGCYLHEWGNPGEHHEGIGVPTGVDVTTGYFRYGMLVDDTGCTPFFERKPVLDPKSQRPLRWSLRRSAELDAQNDQFWMLLTLALRADVAYPPALRPDQRSTRLRVDYVRVYA